MSSHSECRWEIIALHISCLQSSRFHLVNTSTLRWKYHWLDAFTEKSKSTHSSKILAKIVDHDGRIRTSLDMHIIDQFRKIQQKGGQIILTWWTEIGVRTSLIRIGGTYCARSLHPCNDTTFTSVRYSQNRPDGMLEEGDIIAGSQLKSLKEGRFQSVFGSENRRIETCKSDQQFLAERRIAHQDKCCWWEPKD